MRMTWITTGIPHHMGSNGMSPPEYIPGRKGLQTKISLAVQEGLLAIMEPPMVQRRMEHGGLKALVTKSSEPTHTKDTRLVSKSVPAEAMADAGITRQKSRPVLYDIAKDRAVQAVSSMGQSG